MGQPTTRSPKVYDSACGDWHLRRGLTIDMSADDPKGACLNASDRRVGNKAIARSVHDSVRGKWRPAHGPTIEMPPDDPKVVG